MNWQNFSENIFQKVFIDSGSSPLSPVIMSMSIPFLSRKRVQNYCFITYKPNFIALFFHPFLELSRKKLILKRITGYGKKWRTGRKNSDIPYFVTRARIKRKSERNCHICNRHASSWGTWVLRWQIREIEVSHLQQQQTVKRGRKTLAWQTISNRKRMKDSHLQTRCRCGRKLVNDL